MGTAKAPNNFQNENLNPCFDEGKLSAKCLKENFYDSKKCVWYFENYKNCLQFWKSVRHLRMKYNVKPTLPDKEERIKILKEKERGNNIYQAN